MLFYSNTKRLCDVSLPATDCLYSFTDLEELDETELYMCHKCKKRQKSTKKFWIQKLPKVMEVPYRNIHLYSM